MDEFAPPLGAALPWPRPLSCPPWCADGLHHDLDPPGTALHRSPPAVVAVYDEACALIAAHVRAAFWDKAPEWIGTDPADLERPHVEVNIPDGGDGAGVPVYLTPGQARSFAAALVRAAAADTVHRTPVPPPGITSAAVPGGATSPQA